MAKNYYQILGVSQWATDEALQAAIQQITLELGEACDEESMEALRMARKAYAILSNPKLRANYDYQLAQDAPLNLPHNDLSWPQTRRNLNRQVHNESNIPMLSNRRGKTPILLLLAGLVGLAILLSIQKEHMQRAESQLAASEKALNAALAEKDKALTQIQSELGERQKGLENRQLELDKALIELEYKKAEIAQSAIDANKDVAIRQIDSGAAIANRTLDMQQPIMQADIDYKQAQAQVTHEQIRSMALSNRSYQYDYDRRIQNERLGIMTESVLRDKYRQQELNGEDRITRSNPGLGRW
jgi:curved DNA-binding protein CbpA